jgi:phosphoglycolate phosphatase-like HAD superfamily hydrolase
MGGRRYDPGVTEPALPALALDRLEAVVFDTDGVLTDTASVHAAAWKRLFDEYLQLRASRDGDAMALPIQVRPGRWRLAPQLILALAAAGLGRRAAQRRGRRAQLGGGARSRTLADYQDVLDLIDGWT